MSGFGPGGGPGFEEGGNEQGAEPFDRRDMLLAVMLLGIEQVHRADGQVACGLVLGSDLVATVPTKMRIFQGWRYLETEDAPADLTEPIDESMPPALLAELRELGII